MVRTLEKHGRGESDTAHPQKYKTIQGFLAEDKTLLPFFSKVGKSFFGLTIIECYASRNFHRRYAVH